MEESKSWYIAGMINKEKCECGTSILDFVISYVLLLLNTCFKEKEKHIIIFKVDSATTK